MVIHMPLSYDANTHSSLPAQERISLRPSRRRNRLYLRRSTQGVLARRGSNVMFLKEMVS